MTLQVLTIKHVPTQQGQPDRIRFIKLSRMVVSDGINFMQGMLAAGMNDFIKNGQVVKHSIVRIPRSVTNVISNKRILIILGMEPLTPGTANVAKIGSPEGFVAEVKVVQPQMQPTAFNTNNNMYPQPSIPIQQPQQQMQKQGSINGYANTFGSGPQSTPAQNSKFSSDSGIHMIKDLNPYQNRWTIKVRVLSKGEIKSWSNAKGEGRLFSCVFGDESGEIRATGFKEAVNMFYDLLVEGQAYLVSKGTLKTANRQYSTVNNEYELTLDTSTTIARCTDAMPGVTYKPVEISQLSNVEPNGVVDVIAVVQDPGTIQEITTKAQKQLLKRDVTLVDMSGWAIRCTLWGKMAEQYEDSNHPILAIKGAKVGDYGGRSLSSGFDSFMELNPDVPYGHKLRGWYDSVGSSINFQSFSGGSGGSGAIGAEASITLSQISENRLGQSDKPDYFTSTGTITHIRQENCMYPACPTCSKKVVETGDSWRCEKCDSSYPEPKYR